MSWNFSTKAYRRKLVAPSDELFMLLQGCHDRLAQMIDAVAEGVPVGSVDKLIERIKKPGASGHRARCRWRCRRAGRSGGGPGGGHGQGLRRAARRPGQPGRRNLDLPRAYRAAGQRCAVALNEMETTIERMRDQLRRLDSETQGRILSRQQFEAERLGYEEFDPLEMDRHSQLQQLSRRCSNRPPTCWTSRKPSSVATRTPTTCCSNRRGSTPSCRKA
jgi:chemosensory pili system protein ChpA (sensor histidine kinase/response regulator)